MLYIFIKQIFGGTQYTMHSADEEIKKQLWTRHMQS